MTLEQVAALLKLLLYAGALIGGGVALAAASLGVHRGETGLEAARWIAGGAVLAMFAALAGAGILLRQLGGFDGPILLAVLAAPTGLALGLQLGGGALLLAARRPSRLGLRLAGAVALLASFGVSGHAAATSPFSGGVAALHLLAAAWWLGSLLLLRSACATLSAAALADLTRHFGRLALAVIGALLTSGVFLVLLLVPLEAAAWLTPYAQNLALKIAFAALALAIATYARNRLLPRLARGAAAAPQALRRTVTLEIALIGGALAATAWLTTFHSPHEYHPEENGLEALPDGAALYAARVKALTASDLTPEEIHQLGLEEVNRIEGEMLAIARQLRIADLASLDAALESDPKLDLPSDERIVARYQRHLYAMQVRLPMLFGRLPKAGLEVLPAEAVADYVPAAPDGSRRGRLYVDPHPATRRQTIEVEATAYREGVPGRHLQHSLQQELTAPPSRRQAASIAFEEGWALYAEGLAYEVGLLQDPYSRLGQLQHELLAALRLVTDTGLHEEGWTREQAAQYLRDHSALGETEIEREIDLSLAAPGRALAAKIGQLKILELRQRAEQALGPRFDVRAFHDQLLGAGPLPLDVLEQRIDSWIAAPAPEGEASSPYGAHSHL